MDIQDQLDWVANHSNSCVKLMVHVKRRWGGCLWILYQYNLLSLKGQLVLCGCRGAKGALLSLMTVCHAAAKKLDSVLPLLETISVLCLCCVMSHNTIPHDVCSIYSYTLKVYISMGGKWISCHVIQHTSSYSTTMNWGCSLQFLFWMLGGYSSRNKCHGRVKPSTVCSISSICVSQQAFSQTQGFSPSTHLPLKGSPPIEWVNMRTALPHTRQFCSISEPSSQGELHQALPARQEIVQVAPATPVLRGFDDALGKQCYIQARPQETSYPFILASQHQTLRGVPVW